MEWLFDEDNRELFGEIETVNPAMLERLMDLSPFLCALFCEWSWDGPAGGGCVVLWWCPLPPPSRVRPPPGRPRDWTGPRTPPDQPCALPPSLRSLRTLADLTPPSCLT